MSAAGVGAKAAAVVAALKRLGFEEVRQKGRHLVLRSTTTKADGSAAAVICVVPLHRRDLAVGTMKTAPPRNPTPSPSSWPIG